MTTLFLLLFFFLPSPVWATWHLYIIPYASCHTFADPCGGAPTYQPNFGFTQDEINKGMAQFNWAVLRYGGQPYALIAADVSDAVDTIFSTNVAITKIPDDLDQQVGSGAALTAVQNALENRFIPGTWVTATTTYRTILRVVRGASTVLLRYRKVSGNFGPIVTGAVTLNTTFSQLPLAARNNLAATATELGLDTSGITGGSTMRQILKAIGDQFAATPFTLGGITI